VQGFADTASIHENWIGLELHPAVLIGQLEAIKSLAEGVIRLTCGKYKFQVSISMRK